MSGTFERLAYDPATYATDLKQSTDPLLYRLDPSYCVICNPCRPAQPGYIGRIGVSLTEQRPLIDVESDLLLLNRLASRDPNMKYQPNCPQCQNCGSSGYPCGGGVASGCQNCQEALLHFPTCNIGTEYTRYTNPLCTSKEVGINRFVPLYLDPQDEARWLQPSEVGVNCRMMFKDNHVPCLPKLIDQSPALPKGGNIPCNLTVPVCANFDQPLHITYQRLNRNWNGLA